MDNKKKDLTQDRAVTKALSSVGSTVEAFADRMKRKLKEQESLADEFKKASDTRHAMILQALTAIRKALQETAKISLGDRFHFELEISDWEGWPRLDLNLIDGANPDVAIQALTVTAHDRNESGLVQMAMKTGELLGRIMLKDPEEFEKLPIVLKRAIRRFLDAVAPLVLAPILPAHHKNKSEQVVVHAVQDVATAKALQKENFFMEELKHNDNTVSQDDTDVKPLDEL